MDAMSIKLTILITLIISHSLVAMVGSVVLSTIPKRIYPRKIVILCLCWFIPFFGLLLLLKRGQYVPSLGSIEYQSALKLAAIDYETELSEQEQDRSIRYRDSGYGGQSGGYDGGDGGGD